MMKKITFITDNIIAVIVLTLLVNLTSATDFPCFLDLSSLYPTLKKIRSYRQLVNFWLRTSHPRSFQYDKIESIIYALYTHVLCL